MKYDYPAVPTQGGHLCRNLGHTWAKRVPLWRRLLGLPQTCSRCKTRRRA